MFLGVMHEMCEVETGENGEREVEFRMPRFGAF